MPVPCFLLFLFPEKYFCKYSRNRTKQKPKALFSPDCSRRPKRSRGRAAGGPHHRPARGPPLPRRHMVWGHPGSPDAAPSPIYSFVPENPSTESQFSRTDTETPPPSTLTRGVQKFSSGTLPERGIITGGLYITMPASGLMRE